MNRIKNAVKNHQADTALIQAQIESLEQKAKLLQAENQRAHLHIGLIEIIAKFQKNAMNHTAVLVNLITQKIEKHPGLPDTFKAWPNSELFGRDEIFWL